MPITIGDIIAATTRTLTVNVDVADLADNLRAAADTFYAAADAIDNERTDPDRVTVDRTTLDALRYAVTAANEHDHGAIVRAARRLLDSAG